MLSLAGLLARVINVWDHVFPEIGPVRLLGADPYFHLRHAQFFANHFPDLQRWDIGTHYPSGQRTDAVSLFDVCIGSVAYCLGLGNPSERLIAIVAAWTPAVLGALSISVLYLLAQSVMSRPAALAASAMYLLYPGSSLHRSLLGFSDHHVAEIVMGVLIAWGLTRCLQEAEGGKLGWPQLLSTAKYASPLAAFMFTWLGAPIYLPLILVVLFIVAAIEAGHDSESLATARASLLYGGATLVIVGLVGVLWPDLVMSEIQFPSILKVALLIAVAPAAFSYLCRAVVRKVGNPWVVAMACLAVFAAAAAIVVWQSPIAHQLVSMLLKPKGMSLSEHRVVDLMVYWKLLGPAGVLAVMAVPLVVARSIRVSESRHALVALLMGAAWTALWIRTNDYDYMPPVFVALLAAFVIDAIVNLVSTVEETRIRRGLVGALCVVIICPIWPIEQVVKPWATSQMTITHLTINDGWVQALEWLRNETPKPSLPIDAPAQPWPDGRGGFRYPAGTYGVFAPWDFGNMVNVLGRRVPVWSRWPIRRTARWLLSEDEEKSRQLLCPHCEDGEQVRYVILEARTIADHFPGKVIQAGRKMSEYDTQLENWFPTGTDNKILHRTYGPRYHDSMAVRLYLDDARHLGHYRLVYQSPHQSYIPYLLTFGSYRFKRVAYKIQSDARREEFAKRSGIGRVGRAPGHFEYDGVITGTVKIFEHVNGARLKGTTAPHSIVEARLPLRCGPEGRTVNYTRSVQTGDDGHFELVVAHATTPRSGEWTCSSDGPYEILARTVAESDGVISVRVKVKDRHVRRGKTIDVGRLN